MSGPGRRSVADIAVAWDASETRVQAISALVDLRESERHRQTRRARAPKPWPPEGPPMKSAPIALKHTPMDQHERHQ
jgi:hypothetical protein